MLDSTNFEPRIRAQLKDAEELCALRDNEIGRTDRNRDEIRQSPLRLRRLFKDEN